MPYITQRACRCDIIILNMHPPTKDKRDDAKDSFYKDLEHVLSQFLKYHRKMMLEDFIVKVERIYFQANNRE